MLIPPQNSHPNIRCCQGEFCHRLRKSAVVIVYGRDNFEVRSSIVEGIVAKKAKSTERMVDIFSQLADHFLSEFDSMC